MKRLLLLSVLLMPFLVLLSPIVSADENKVCFILLADYSVKTLSEKLKQQNCKSDNVLVAKFFLRYLFERLYFVVFSEINVVAYNHAVT